jgi:hypothetical protein
MMTRIQCYQTPLQRKFYPKNPTSLQWQIFNIEKQPSWKDWIFNNRHLLFFLLISKVSSFLVFLRKFWERETEACLVPQNPPLSKKKKKKLFLAGALSLSLFHGFVEARKKDDRWIWN